MEPTSGVILVTITCLILSTVIFIRASARIVQLKETIDDLYSELTEQDTHWGAISELREGDEETGLPCEYSRHYESESVAAQMPDGSWVGWTYWSGGGKHGEPEAMDWMGEAYDLNCKEEQKMVTVREFKKL